MTWRAFGEPNIIADSYWSIPAILGTTWSRLCGEFLGVERAAQRLLKVPTEGNDVQQAFSVSLFRAVVSPDR